MPLLIPDGLPAKPILEGEEVFIMDKMRADTQDIRPLKVGILNLMPKKEETETQLLRMLSNTALQVEFDLIRTESYMGTHTAQSHLDKFYKTFSEIKNNKYDAFVVTGAPIEKLEYEDVIYWEELEEIFEYVRENVFSTMFICWASQAALYYYYGIPKYSKESKIFGVYDFTVKKRGALTKGLDDVFYMPQSRYTYVKGEDVKKVPDLEIWAEREDIGVNIVSSKDGRFIFVAGHGEYDEDTLYKEYIRDKNKGLNPKIPINYFYQNDENQGIITRWRASSNLIFSNWLNYCVYQETPYDLSKVKKKKVSKFGGSSLADATHFSKVKDIIEDEEGREVIVVSAPGKRNPEDVKVTDMLLSLYNLNEDYNDTMKLKEKIEKLLEENENKREEEKREIKDRFFEIIRDLKLERKVYSEISDTIDEISKSRERDFIVSRGEYLNAILLSEFLDYEFIDAKDLIFFDENGKFEAKKSYESIRKHISPDKKYVIPGFYGADKDGKIKTFDRGGSDITGSIVAGALNSEMYENWTDVDGVMTADPNKDKNARTIDNLTYEELLQITKDGANVYHKDAIDFVRRSNVPINIRNTNNPKFQGTIIKNPGEKNE